MNYELIIIILASSKNNYELKLKKLQSKYLNTFNNIKYLFAELNTLNNIEINKDHICIEENDCNSYIEDNNTIYFKNENNKSVSESVRISLSIDYINKKYNYKYILVTEIDTFLNIPLILNYLVKLENNDPIYCGFQNYGYVLNSFLILNRISGNILINNYRRHNYLELNSEIIIAQVMVEANIPYIKPDNLLYGVITDNNYICKINYLIIYYQTFNKYVELELDNKLLILKLNNESNNILNLIYFNYLIKKFYNI